MKRYLIYILLIISSICYGQIYSTNNRIQGTLNTPSYDNYKNVSGNISCSNLNIGYSTSKYRIANTYNTHECQYSDGAHNSRNNGRPNGPRKVHGYTSEGEYVGDDNGNENDFWENGYEYYWDGNKWWRNKTGTGQWREYTTIFDLDWGLNSWDWRNRGKPDTDILTKGYEYPQYPIGEVPIGLLLILVFSYLFYKINDKKINSFI